MTQTLENNLDSGASNSNAKTLRHHQLATITLAIVKPPKSNPNRPVETRQPGSRSTGSRCIVARLK